MFNHFPWTEAIQDELLGGDSLTYTSMMMRPLKRPPHPRFHTNIFMMVMVKLAALDF